MAMPCGRVHIPYLKNEATWCSVLVGFQYPTCYTARRVFDGQCHGWHGAQNDGLFSFVWQNPDGNRNVPYLNRNDSNRKLNLNWIDNDWNDICRFAAVRNWLQYKNSPLSRRVLFQLLPPPAEHFPDFHKWRCKQGVFLCINHFQFPCGLQKEFERIKLG